MTDLADRPEEASAPRRKRSRHVALLLAGAAVLTLAACEDDAVDAQAFPDLDSCLAAAQTDGLWFTADDCRTQFAAAEQTHLETAPRYESRELCEEEHGAGACGADPAAGDPAAQQQGGGGFSFMPLLVGYMMGSMLSRGGGVFSQPMVRTPGGYSTPSGNQTFASNSGSGRVPAQAFNRAPTTIGQQPMSRAQVAQRGGFGAGATARTATGGSRGFGG
ncbi:MULTISPECIES: DUF1190 domain-containing protein [unclassified Paracoccus (in: a-proteobacteria)]|uniref:DUF1190 domain-containing protein n=1 Tax=unclassified Paracoccus (in: a-proteobacteria) TaxID=2688777 RepID=UPI00160264E9|nr:MULTISPECIES: DUF1190 domain-containing protein [unclassified Paracoccus (in: a-proteobacteria)]MBB1491902.1 DUF1190 domain-containing protein [Paracoccus sp. MC1854]MBB1498235.1 DUF1190 domain-containing protein [Paracoccus sp. MC1862]QQO45724.1 DUF1190 domain-containing protein [Paracoccus sp. MC1862]